MSAIREVTLKEVFDKLLGPEVSDKFSSEVDAIMQKTSDPAILKDQITRAWEECSQLAPTRPDDTFSPMFIVAILRQKLTV